MNYAGCVVDIPLNMLKKIVDQEHLPNRCEMIDGSLCVVDDLNRVWLELRDFEDGFQSDISGGFGPDSFGIRDWCVTLYFADDNILEVSEDDSDDFYDFDDIFGGNCWLNPLNFESGSKIIKDFEDYYTEEDDFEDEDEDEEEEENA